VTAAATSGDGALVTVRLPSALREYADGAASVDVHVAADGPTTVGALLDRIGAQHPALHRRVRDERGELRRHVNVFVGERNVRQAELLDTVVPPGTEVYIAPAVSGG
jgi:molybdopterin converting factor small subunit